MIHLQAISIDLAVEEFGTKCQRLLPLRAGLDLPEPGVGAMACFLAPLACSNPDRHNQDELIVVLAGSARVVVGDEEADVGSGEVVFLPRNITHVIHNTSAATGLSWLSVYWPLHEYEETQ